MLLFQDQNKNDNLKQEIVLKQAILPIDEKAFDRQGK